ncbi:hypothetical protein TNCT_531521 [Trichonephila clavata]|uniref:Uncharacterized protein n=1 Tax=Trichonephila clavata TaxID=2740835 RepID=A0A8X6IXM6_TRICU|nr:hypothetical protein TNCT_531521 [Trichonephila clavata]
MFHFYKSEVIDIFDEEGAQELKKFQERFSPQSLAVGPDSLESKPDCNMLCSESSNDALETSFKKSSCVLPNPLMQNSNNCYSLNSIFNDSASLTLPNSLHTPSDNCNVSTNGSFSAKDHCFAESKFSYISNQQQFVKVENLRINYLNQVNHSKFAGAANINNYDKIEKMEICSYGESDNHIENKYVIEPEKSILPVSINSLKQTQNIDLAQYSHDFIGDNINSYSSCYFDVKTESSSHVIEKEVAFPSTPLMLNIELMIHILKCNLWTHTICTTV